MRGTPRSPPIHLSRDERATLESWAAAPATRRGLRARIVLRCAEGGRTSQVSAALGVTPQTVRRWRDRFVEGRLESLEDRPRPGAARIREDEIERVMALTLHAAPPGGRRWTTRSLAGATGLSQSTISRIWRSFEMRRPGTGAPARGPGDASRPRVRGRGARLRRAAFQATWELLEEGGWSAVSIEAVAKRTGVHRTTLYRIWSNPIRLVVDAAFDRYTRAQRQAPDTGRLRSDVAHFARIHADDYAHRAAGVMFAGLILERERHPEITSALREMEQPYREVFQRLCARAVSRGEVAEDTDAELLMEVVVATIFLHRVVRGIPVDAAWAERLARLVVEGLARRPAALRKPLRAASRAR